MVEFCGRCAELERALSEALAAGEPDEIEIGSAEEVSKLKKAVRIAQARAREAEKKSKEATETSTAYVVELTKWRAKLAVLDQYSNKKCKKIIGEMLDRYVAFILNDNEE